MIDLQTLLEAIDQLGSEDLEKVRVRVEQRSQALYKERMEKEDPETWITGLQAAITAFRADLSPDRLAEILNDMNIGYISPKELAILEQLGEWEEDAT